MAEFLIRRLVQSALLLAVMSVLVFLAVFAVGNPVDILISPEANQADRTRAIASLGLDRPLLDQYLAFVGGLLRGDLGQSFVFKISALELILQRLPATLELAVSAMILAVAIGLPLGLVAGLRPDGVLGRAIMAGSILGFSLPTFWVGLILILVFAVHLGWLPSTGRGATAELFGIRWSFLTLDGLAHLALPALNLALFKISLVIRLTRAGLRETMPLDYIRYAHAKGLSERRVILVHALKNIMIPLVTVLGLEFGSVIAFAIVTETIFAWPGTGKLIIDSIGVLDRPVMVAYLLVIVLMFIVINLVVDVLYSVLDPRVRLFGLHRMSAEAVERLPLAARVEAAEPRLATVRDAPAQPATAPAPRRDPGVVSPARQTWAEFVENPFAVFGLVLLGLIMAAAAGASWIAPTDPYDLTRIDLMDALQPPGGESADGATRFLLGSDAQGRDMLSAILYGLRTSIVVGVSSGVLALLIGMTLGLIAAYFGGWADTLLMRLVDLQLSFPSILVAMVLLAALGQGVDKIVLALVIVQWAYYARTVRGAAMAERQKEYVEAAIALGIGRRRVMFRHMLRNCLPPLFVVATVQVGNAIALEATLSFLGLGLPVTEPSLGLLISNGFAYLMSGRTWISIYPGVALLLTIVAINLVGDHLRDVLNPRLKR